MSDVVVTVPKTFGWQTWIDEGDAAGEPWSGQHWDFITGGARPKITPGERVYVVHNGTLRGYAPLVALQGQGRHINFVRGGDAVAVTIPEAIPGFRGWRYRWWDRKNERSFRKWRTP